MKSCLIEFSHESAGLGDLIAMLPYVERFGEINSYKIYFKYKTNSISRIFESSYPSITFINNESSINYDNKILLSYNRYDVSIQQVFASQLGFEDYKYLKPKVDDFNCDRPIKNKYITFSIHSTSQLKYWNHPDGVKDYMFSSNWNNLCKMIRKSGYTPVCIDTKDNFGVDPIRNYVPASCVKKLGLDIVEMMKLIKHSEFFIGLSSGLTWLAHAMDKPICMISNFTEDWNEMNIHSSHYKRITNKTVCHGCWNLVGNEFTFDRSNWFWCPKHIGTNRQFECHTSITPEMVFSEIKEWLI